MLEFLFKRIINNKWLFMCLLLGALSSCAIFSSIPMYSNAILQKVLTKDLENYHATRGLSPGLFEVKLNSHAINNYNIDTIADIIENNFAPSYRLPAVSRVKMIEAASRKIKRIDDNSNTRSSFASLVSLSDIENHIELVHGHLPGKEPTDGVYEVMVTEEAMKELNLLFNETYGIYESSFIAEKETLLLKVKIVGIFTVKSPDDIYWSQRRFNDLDDSILLDESLLLDILDNNRQIWISRLQWSWYFDYYSVRIQNTQRIVDIYNQQKRWNDRNNNVVSLYTPLEEVLKNYSDREKQLRITLWILTVPLMIILCFYSILITGLIVKNDKNEIAILKSRGAGTLQIFMLYVFESLLVASFSAVAGPFIALFICRILGSSNGFMEFVNRKALNLEINFEIIMYSLTGALLFVLFMLIPALGASRKSIVQYKRSRLDYSSKPFWQKLYLDVLVMGLSAYGLYSFQNRQEILQISGLSGTDLKIDPLLYFVSTFFILGVGLVFLRIYPLLVRSIFKLGEKWWNPVTYFSLVNVGRSDANSQFIMLFLMLALAFGIMNANQARTINRNIDDKILYLNGADVVIEPYNNLKHQNEFLGYGISEMDGSGVVDKPEYIEPPYEEYKKIKGVQSITKVLNYEKSSLTFGKNRIPGLKLLGIIPHEFGNTVWFRNDLLPHHINEYLNVMTNSPVALFLSSNVKSSYDIEVGDEVTVSFGDYGTLPFIVYGFVDYFPSCNPFNEKNGTNNNYFAVLNLSYVQRKLPAQPYEIWIRKVPGTPDGLINEELINRNLAVERVDYSLQEIIKMRNDPILQGTNGSLTMCFIITMLITAIGFIIFWILSIKDRTLKFGIFRAIGMPMRSVTMIMVLEQLLISGCAIVAGVILGSAGSKIFIPMLQMVYSSANQVPPFKITALKSDYLKVLVITMSMLLLALTLLAALIKRLKVNQVLKLGED